VARSRLNGRGKGKGECVIFVDAAQQLHRASVSFNRSPCIVPKAYIFDSMKGRFLSGSDFFAFQGIDLGMFKACGRFSEAQLKDLAGNAFAAPVFTSMLLSLLVGSE